MTRHAPRASQFHDGDAGEDVEVAADTADVVDREIDLIVEVLARLMANGDDGLFPGGVNGLEEARGGGQRRLRTADGDGRP